MCTRRVFEILASVTHVVSGESSAIHEFFGAEQVPIVRDDRTAQHVLRSVLNSPQARDRMVHTAQRKIWSNHTYAHRAAKVLDSVGLEVKSPRSEERRVGKECRCRWWRKRERERKNEQGRDDV